MADVQLSQHAVDFWKLDERSQISAVTVFFFFLQSQIVKSDTLSKGFIMKTVIPSIIWSPQRDQYHLINPNVEKHAFFDIYIFIKS